MYFVSFYINSSERSGGAQILACSAAYAASLVDGGNVSSLFVVRVVGNHLYGSDGTMAGAIPALNAIGQWDAVFLDPYCMSNLSRGFVFMPDRLDGAGRTYLRTAGAFRTAVS